jgi:hypothetical protein
MLCRPPAAALPYLQGSTSSMAFDLDTFEPVDYAVIGAVGEW